MNKSIYALAARSEYYQAAEQALVNLSHYIHMSDEEFCDKLDKIWAESVRDVRYRLQNWECPDELAIRLPGHYIVKSFEKRFANLAGKVRWDDRAQMFRPRWTARDEKTGLLYYVDARACGMKGYQFTIMLNKMYFNK